MEKLLKIGLQKDGKLKQIEEVANGLACNCFCPNCERPLVAKNNIKNIKEAHFAHASGKECAGAVETAIHLLAKQVFAETKTIKLPPYHHDYVLENSLSLYGAADQEIVFDTILIEESVEVNGRLIRPDAIGIKDGQKIFVEFAKTHFIEPEKEKLIKLSGFACIELDLNKVLQTWEGVNDFLLNSSGTPFNKWVSNPKMDNKYEVYWKQKLEKEQERIQREEARKQRAETLKRLKYTEREALIRQYRLDKSILVLRINNKNNTAYQCPLKKKELIEFTKTAFYKVPTLKRIIDGEHWNGSIYGFDYDERYIFLSKDRIYIYANNDTKRADLNFNPNFIYKGLHLLKEKVFDRQLGSCSNCKYAGDWFEAELIQVCQLPRPIPEFKET